VRTTITLEDDVLELARALASARHASFRFIINEALRNGLAALGAEARQQPHRTRPRPMGLRPAFDLDNVQELLARLDGEDSR